MDESAPDFYIDLNTPPSAEGRPCCSDATALHSSAFDCTDDPAHQIIKLLRNDDVPWLQIHIFYDRDDRMVLLWPHKDFGPRR